MIITGLNKDRYLINNPIWSDIQNADEKIVLTVVSGNSSFNFIFYTFGGKVEIDLSEIVKGILGEPNHPFNIVNGTIILSTTINLSFIFVSGDEQITINRTFIRGGEASMRSNISLPVLAKLKESNRIPVWQGYPASKYTLNASNQVVFENILVNEEIDRRPVVVCSPVYLRFLNTKGGYSHWLFEQWEIKEKIKPNKRIKRRGYPIDLGSEAEWELSVETRVESEYQNTLSALLKSSDVYVWNLDSVLDLGAMLIAASQWTKIYVTGGDVSRNSFDDLKEYKLTFDLLLKENPQVFW